MHAPFPVPRLAGAAALLLLVACSDATSPDAAPGPGDIVVPRGRLEAHVRTLAHDSMCGRLVGTAYEYQAAQYIAGELADAGVSAAGTDGYFQTVLGPIPLQSPPATTTCAASPLPQSQNVIGALEGRGALAAQWVVVGAHYDHVGWAESNGSALVFNGADDNASGTAVMIEVARALAGWIAAHAEATPASYRSVMFHAYGAEEVGLVGSEQYALAPTVPADALHAVVNLDMVGRLRDQTLIVAGAGTAPGWTGLLAAARPDGVTIGFSDESLTRSDQWSFIGLLGVPGLHLFTGTHADYHTIRDDPELLNYEGMQTVAQVTLGLVWRVMTVEDALAGGG
jgi:Zn-dependent M28 family amino/carboxypeptidase